MGYCLTTLAAELLWAILTSSSSRILLLTYPSSSPWVSDAPAWSGSRGDRFYVAFGLQLMPSRIYQIHDTVTGQGCKAGCGGGYSIRKAVEELYRRLEPLIKGPIGWDE